MGTGTSVTHGSRMLSNDVLQSSCRKWWNHGLSTIIVEFITGVISCGLGGTYVDGIM